MHLMNLCSIDECRFSSSRSWEALTNPDYKDSTAANRTPFNLAYNTDMGIFQYLSEVRSDIGHRAKLAMAGKGLNLDQYLACTCS